MMTYNEFAGYRETIESLRQQLTAAKEETTIDEQRVADLMDQVGELSNQLSSRDAEVKKVKSDNEYLYVAAIERDQLREQVALLRDALTESRRELDSCQKVIWLASDYGFDPAYVKGAQAQIRKTDEALAATEPTP